jgi:hypothetical protein
MLVSYVVFDYLWYPHHLTFYLEVLIDAMVYDFPTLMNDTAPFFSFFSFLDNVLRTVLALFMEDEALPLPSLEEVLICNPNTTAEEVRGET